MNEFETFVLNELGDVAKNQSDSKKIQTYAWCWIWSKFYKNFSAMLNDMEIMVPEHSTYEITLKDTNGEDITSKFTIDRSSQYKRIYDHRKI